MSKQTVDVVPTKKSVHIEIVAFTESHPVAFQAMLTLVARHYQGSPSESTARVPQYAFHPGIWKRGDGLAGPPDRCTGLRGGSAARLRAHHRQRSSNRQNTGDTTRIGIRSEEGREITETRQVS